MKATFNEFEIEMIKHAADQYKIAKISKQGKNFLRMLEDAKVILKKSKQPLYFQLSRNIILEVLDWLYEEEEPYDEASRWLLVDKLEEFVMKGDSLIYFSELPIGSFFNDGIDDVGIYVKTSNDEFHNAKVIFYFEDKDNKIVKSSEIPVTFRANSLIQKTK